MATSKGVKTKYLHKVSLSLELSVLKVKMSKFTMQRPHQNVVLKCSKLDYIKIKKITDIEGLGTVN